MCTKRYYPLINRINFKLRVNRCYELTTNYQMLYLLSRAFDKHICPSRSFLLRYTGITSPLLREITNNSLDRFLNSGSNERLIIDDRILISKPSLGQFNLDVPSIDDRYISNEINLKKRYG